MKAREQFERLGELYRLLADKQYRRERIISAVTSISVPMESDRVQTSGDKDRIGNAVAKTADLDREIAELMEQYSECLLECFDLIQGLENKAHFDVLMHRFIERKSIGETAEEMCLSPDYVKQLQRAAMRILDGEE